MFFDRLRKFHLFWNLKKKTYNFISLKNSNQVTKLRRNRTDKDEISTKVVYSNDYIIIKTIVC